MSEKNLNEVNENRKFVTKVLPKANEDGSSIDYSTFTNEQLNEEVVRIYGMSQNEFIERAHKFNEKGMCLRNYVDTIKAIQGLRIRQGQRILANMRIKLLRYPYLNKVIKESILAEAEEKRIAKAKKAGKTLEEIKAEAPQTSIEEMADEIESDDLVAYILKDHKTIIDYLTTDKKNTLKKYFKNPYGIITEDIEYYFVENYLSLVEQENILKKTLESELMKFPIYSDYLVKIKGCGVSVCSKLIAKLNPYASRHRSGFSKYCGIDVVAVPDENDPTVVRYEGRGKKHAKYNQVTYINKDGEEAVKNSLGYDPEMKSLVLKIFIDNVLRAGKGSSKYNDLYYQYKARYSNRADLQGESKGHIEAMTRRAVARIFLNDLWVVWRQKEGLPYDMPYEVAKLGYCFHETSMKADQMEDYYGASKAFQKNLNLSDEEYETAISYNPQ